MTARDGEALKPELLAALIYYTGLVMLSATNNIKLERLNAARAEVTDLYRTLSARVAEVEAKLHDQDARRVCAAAYQAAGASDWPEAWLDILSNAANGVALRHDPLDLLPFEPPK